VHRYVASQQLEDRADVDCGGCEQLLAEAQSGNGEARDEVRRLMLALFDELGTEDELTQRYRRRLAAALY